MARTRRASQLAHANHENDSGMVEERPVKKAKLSQSESQDTFAGEDEIGSQSVTSFSQSKSETSTAGGGSQLLLSKSKPSKKILKPEDYPRRVSSPWKVGAHISAAGGVENSIVNAAAIGANSFALFLKSQRKWTSPPLKETSISTFKARMKEFGYEPRHVLPHGSYLINLGNPDEAKREKSYECFLDDLKRCEQLGLEVYNFHPGSTVGETTVADSISLIAESINRAHKATQSVITVLENMAGAGNIIGSDFAHLAGIINEVEDKSRVGVCLDTCHMFAAGYDIRTKEGWDATVLSFDTLVGLSYLRGMHLNDSKMIFDSKRDRHENIGLGHIGLSAFHHILTDTRMQDLPLILETPSFEKPEVWAKELEVLNKLANLEMGPEVTEGVSLVDGIKEVVKKAGGGVTPKRKAKAKTGTKRGRKETEEDHDDETEDDEHSH